MQLGQGYRESECSIALHRLPLPVGFPSCHVGERICISTWAVEGIAQPIVVVPLEEGEADVSRACGWGLPELQC